MRVLLIIPAYNEEENILSTIAEITAWKKANMPELEYIVVNDGSTDRTAALCRQQGVPLLSLVHNLGIGGAVQTGYRYAHRMGYDAAVQFDGDGQHDVASLPALLAPLAEDRADFVVGSRFLGGSAFRSTAARRWGIGFLSVVLRACTGQRFTDPTSGYRAAGSRVIAQFARCYPDDYPEPESLATLLKLGYRVAEVPAHMRARQGGASSIAPRHAFYYMVKVTLSILSLGALLGAKRRKEL